MINVDLTVMELDLVISALETVYQIEGLGFDRYERDLALELQERLENSEEDYNELDFED